jgi:hypothetical protein
MGLSRCAIATFNEGEISELNAVGQGHPETIDRVSGKSAFHSSEA